ncbi:hypothetical protein BAR24066_01533 [Burkholderia arboris]|uniref:Uncharacterized protein n=1 Tax=Burkholderia arboris TaxID=488730 RepID=A0A9Q9UPE0_9BURK|nr:hypothetical protein [Burkholderia arboris]VWB35236.1 hypothetical protein BAR24066_01533 [Burkholderia arboris]
MDAKNEQPAKKHIAEWPWAAIVLVIGWIGFWILYSSGDAYYRAFLSSFNVEADGFPIDQYRHFVLSAFSGLNFMSLVDSWANKNKSALMVFLGAYVLFLVAVVIISLVSDGKENKAAKYVSRHPVLRVIRDVLFAWYVFPTSLFFISASFMFGASLPAAFAEAAGNAVAERSAGDYKKGCDQSTENCQIALKNGAEIARGYVIAQSTTRIALFNNGSTVQIPLDGVELRTVPKALKPRPPAH